MDTLDNNFIGIFGGSFNPIHYGHLRSAIELQEIFELQRLLLIPCANPAHREISVTAEHRIAMVQLAINNLPKFYCDTRELNRGGKSYTLETLKSLRKDFKNETLLLFVGTDAFAKFTTWYCWQQIFEFAHVVVLLRPDNELTKNFGIYQDFFSNQQASSVNMLKNSKQGLWFVQPVTTLSISATLIRNLINQQRNPQFLLPDSVLTYIKQHQLYQII